MPSIRDLVKTGRSALAIAIVLTGSFEGVRLWAYKDVVGIPTVCFGETRGVRMGDHYTLEECQAMLGTALVEFQAGMDKCIRKPEAIPNETRAAFDSFAYNVGVNAFCHSSVLTSINAGNLRKACGDLLKWTRGGGRVLSGLVNRRAQENKICLEGLNP
jgi:lysozyme